MTSPADEPGAVLVTGVYGAGKSTVVEDIADLLEKRGVPYGVLDVDWLGWFDAGGDEERTGGWRWRTWRPSAGPISAQECVAWPSPGR